MVDRWENTVQKGGLDLGICKSQAKPTSHSLPERLDFGKMGLEPQFSREREVNTSCSGAPTIGRAFITLTVPKANEHGCEYKTAEPGTLKDAFSLSLRSSMGGAGRGQQGDSQQAMSNSLQ